MRKSAATLFAMFACDASAALADAPTGSAPHRGQIGALVLLWLLLAPPLIAALSARVIAGRRRRHGLPPIPNRLWLAMIGGGAAFMPIALVLAHAGYAYVIVLLVVAWLAIQEGRRWAAGRRTENAAPGVAGPRRARAAMCGAIALTVAALFLLVVLGQRRQPTHAGSLDLALLLADFVCFVLTLARALGLSRLERPLAASGPARPWRRPRCSS